MTKKLVIAGSRSQFDRYYKDDPDRKYIGCREDLDEYLWDEDVKVDYIGTFYDNSAYGSIEHRKLDPTFWYLMDLVDEHRPKQSHRDRAYERYQSMCDLSDTMMKKMARRLFG